MPNWMFNRVTVTGDADSIEKIKSLVKSKEAVFSLNNVFPMPKILEADFCISESEAVEMAHLYAIKNKKALTEKAQAAIARHSSGPVREIRFNNDAERYFNALQETGYATWREWRCDHWGTKWDASDSNLMSERDDCLVYEFYTPWATPSPVLMELSRRFPEVEIMDEFHEETEYEYGTFIFRNGEVQDSFVPSVCE